MEKLGFDLDDGSSPADAKQTNPQVTYRFQNWSKNIHVITISL